MCRAVAEAPAFYGPSKAGLMKLDLCNRIDERINHARNKVYLGMVVTVLINGSKHRHFEAGYFIAHQLYTVTAHRIRSPLGTYEQILSKNTLKNNTDYAGVRLVEPLGSGLAASGKICGRLLHGASIAPAGDF